MRNHSHEANALMRSAGIASICGGALFLVGVAAHPPRDGFTIRSLGLYYGAEHSVILLGLLLQVVALVGVLVWQMERGSPICAAGPSP